MVSNILSNLSFAACVCVCVCVCTVYWSKLYAISLLLHSFDLGLLSHEIIAHTFSINCFQTSFNSYKIVFIICESVAQWHCYCIGKCARLCTLCTRFMCKRCVCNIHEPHSMPVAKVSHANFNLVTTQQTAHYMAHTHQSIITSNILILYGSLV